MLRWLLICLTALSLLGTGALAQSSVLSELWREWEVVHDEWQKERAAWLQDRAIHRRLRERAEQREGP